MIAAVTCPECGHDTAEAENIKQGIYTVGITYSCMGDPRCSYFRLEMFVTALDLDDAED